MNQKYLNLFGFPTQIRDHPLTDKMTGEGRENQAKVDHIEQSTPNFQVKGIA